MDGAAPPPSRRLSGVLVELASRHPTGTLRFDEFMGTALYDPAGGYYTRAETIGGGRRDFSTIPSLSPLLGQAIMRWALSLRDSGRAPLDIIEVGAGGGHLAEAILASAGWWARRGIRYRIVEISPRLRLAQQSLLARRQVIWHDTVDEAVGAAARPVVISNELVDAFPCRLLRFEDGDWREVRLPWPPENEHPLESHPLEDLAPSGFSALHPENWKGGRIPEGQIIEVQPAYRDWLEEWVVNARDLHHLTIDYGDTVPGLYLDRPRGTFRGYFAHQRLTGAAVLRAPGKVDLTCDVNFSDIEAWGRECGLRTVAALTQADFLRRWLPGRHTSNPDGRLKNIMNPEGAGGAFKVLWQTNISK